MLWLHRGIDNQFWPNQGTRHTVMNSFLEIIANTCCSCAFYSGSSSVARPCSNDKSPAPIYPDFRPANLSQSLTSHMLFNIMLTYYTGCFQHALVAIFTKYNEIKGCTLKVIINCFTNNISVRESKAVILAGMHI